MNYLAHLHLSGRQAELMVGNFIGDFVRGRDMPLFSEQVVRGIHLHRQIDQFTDTHPVVKKSVARLTPTYQRYATVIVDIYYDHFLAIHWPKYAQETLPEFAQNTYAILKTYESQLPERVQQMLPHMIQNNWLVNYAELWAIDRALKRMATRAKYNPGIENALYDLEQCFAAFEGDFLTFFPDLQAFVQQHIEQEG